MDSRADPQDPLTRLRLGIDYAPYTPIPGTPAWMQGLSLAAAKDHGVLALLGPSGINVSTLDSGRARAVLDPAALFLSGLANRIRLTRKRIAVGLVPAARHLPLLFAGSVVLANTIDRDINPGIDTRSGVLVISPDLDIRSRYCDLYVASVSLDTAYPGSRMRPMGERVALRSTRENQDGAGVCFFLPNLSLPPKIDFQPGLIILDLRYGRWSKRASALATWTSRLPRGVLALYSVGDTDTLGALTQVGFMDFPLDHSAIATCSEMVKRHQNPPHGLAVDWWMADAPSYLARRHAIDEVGNAELVEELVSSVDHLLNAQAHRRSPDLDRAWWLRAIFVQMPVPAFWYEQTARSLGRSTLKRLIDHLGVRDRYESDLGPVFQTLQALFEQIHSRLGDANPRAESLKRLLPLVIEKTPSNEQVLLLVRDRITERAVESWLEMVAFPGAFWLERVDVRACPDYSEVSTQKYFSAIVNGAFPRRYRWIAGAALGQHIVFLAYPREAEVIRHQLQRIYGNVDRATRARQRDHLIQELLSPQIHLQIGSDIDIPRLIIAGGTHTEKTGVPGKAFKVEIGSLEQLKQAYEAATKSQTALDQSDQRFDTVEDDADEEVAELDLGGAETQSYAEAIACRKICVVSRANGSGISWLPFNEIVEAVRPADPDEIVNLPVAEIRPGDVLLRTDERGRVGLFERIVELAEGQPRLQYLGTFRRTWRRAIQHLVVLYSEAGTNIDYSRLLTTVRQEGATVASEAAVRFWVQDQTIGPETVASIIAVGRVSQSSVIVREAKQFDRAFRKIRSIHRAIGHHLSAAIRKSFRHFAEIVPERAIEPLDDRLGLPLEELLETIDLWEVTSVSEGLEMTAPYRASRLIVL